MPEQKIKSWKLNVPDRVFATQFCPWPWASNLLAIGTKLRVSVWSVKFQEEDPDIEDIQQEVLKEFNNETPVEGIAWSPETSLSLVPKVLRFATYSNKKIQLFTSDLKSEDSVQVLEGHTDYINSISFDHNRGDQLASCSDDQTCRVWARDGNIVACFFLATPGVSVSWHTNEPNKLMVAEKSGTIRFYNMTSQRPTISLSCMTSPLLQADWSFANSMYVGCVANTEWCVWDISSSSFPSERHSAYVEAATGFKWSGSNPHLFATTGNHGRLVKVFHTNMGQVLLSSTQSVSGGISWHHKLPILAAGGDRNVQLWRIDSV